jgi:hypothetical protein
MFTFQLSEEQTNYILNLLAEKPFKEVHGLITAFQQQAQQQIQAAQAAGQAAPADIPAESPVAKGKK